MYAPLSSNVPSGVALLAEGVDRNLLEPPGGSGGSPSPSSRRAWIEICSTMSRIPVESVALLAEGVDRNDTDSANDTFAAGRPLAEGVDRNTSSVLR